MVDCVCHYYNGTEKIYNTGCLGGNEYNVLYFNMINGGMESGITYPYSLESAFWLQSNMRCKFNLDSMVKTGVYDVMIIEEDEEMLKAAIAENGPIACCKFLFF